MKKKRTKEDDERTIEAIKKLQDALRDDEKVGEAFRLYCKHGRPTEHVKVDFVVKPLPWWDNGKE